MVPRQYIPSVETGVRGRHPARASRFPGRGSAVDPHGRLVSPGRFLRRGLPGGRQLALAEALPKAKPVLLEPVLSVEIAIPSEALVEGDGLVTGRRGQILGYDSRPGWSGWDVLNAMIPESEIGDLIVELRSATAGVGTFATRFDHMAELNGRPADLVMQEQARAPIEWAASAVQDSRTRDVGPPGPTPAVHPF